MKTIIKIVKVIGFIYFTIFMLILGMILMTNTMLAGLGS